MPERRAMDITAPIPRGNARTFNGRPLHAARPLAVPSQQNMAQRPYASAPQQVQPSPYPSNYVPAVPAPKMVQDFVAPNPAYLPAPAPAVQSQQHIASPQAGQDFSVPVRRQAPAHQYSQPSAPTQNYAQVQPSPASHKPQQVPVQVRQHSATPAHSVSQPRQLKSQVLRRDGIKPTQPAVKHVGKVKLPKIKKSSVRSKALVALTVFSMIFGVGSGVFAWQTKFGTGEVQGVNELSKNDPEVQTGEHPSEVPPTLDQYKEFAVGAAFPRYVRIPAIGVNARVRQVGLNSENKLQSPANVFDVGWYNRSARPGSEGTMLVTAHVSGPSIAGVFGNLHKLQPGNLIEIEQGSGKKVQYKVVVAKQIEDGEFELSQAMRAVDPAKPSLNLVTTKPLFNPITNKHDPRVVVFAVQADQ